MIGKPHPVLTGLLVPLLLLTASVPGLAGPHVTMPSLSPSSLPLAGGIEGGTTLQTSPLPTPACNRPASDIPPRPDGCLGNEFPVSPPPEPIPPPCIAAWTVEYGVGGDPATGLLITVEHPELNPRTRPRGWVHLARYEGSDAWQLVGIEAAISCGKDESPLAWATLEILNGGDRNAAMAIYTSPLPEDYLHTITTLANWYRICLPLIEVGDTESNRIGNGSHR